MNYRAIPINWANRFILMIVVGMTSVCMADTSNEERPARWPSADRLPADWWPADKAFKLSAAYPTQLLADEASLPWKRDSIDFRNQPRLFLKSVLEYVLEGNIDVAFDFNQRKPDKRWFHVPWMHFGTYGREFISGLTRERNLSVSEVLPQAASDKRLFQVWAVGFYNVIGGKTIGDVWQDGGPHPERASFAPGTVAAKLLYTNATPRALPFLRGAPTVSAQIHEKTACKHDMLPTHEKCRRKNKATRLYLVQVDIAVKDPAAGETGWVFGTFTYNANTPSLELDGVETDAGWNRLIPVGVAWGNDQALGRNSKRKDFVESTILTEHEFPKLGCGERLNGPVDNPASSCIACHGLAQWPRVTSELEMWQDKVCTGDDREARDLWDTLFANRAGNVPMQQQDPPARGLDYSLQFAFAFNNFCAAMDRAHPMCLPKPDSRTRARNGLMGALTSEAELSVQEFSELYRPQRR